MRHKLAYGIPSALVAGGAVGSAVLRSKLASRYRDLAAVLTDDWMKNGRPILHWDDFKPIKPSGFSSFPGKLRNPLGGKRSSTGNSRNQYVTAANYAMVFKDHKEAKKHFKDRFFVAMGDS